MSAAAMVWAERQYIGRGDGTSPMIPSMLKWLLVALAGYEQSGGVVYPSIALLAEKTELDRKTVQAGLAELARRGLIEDTGSRAGRTKQIPVWRLVGFENDTVYFGRQERERRGIKPVSGTAAHANNPVSGTVSNLDDDVPGEPPQMVDSPREDRAPTLAAGDPGQTVPPAGLYVGTVPPANGNDPAVPTKRSRQRDTEHPSNNQRTSDARALARGCARASEPEPESPDARAARLRRWWRSQVLPEFLTAIRSIDRDLYVTSITDLPAPLASRVEHAVQEVVLQFTNAEIRGQHRSVLERDMRSQVHHDAQRVIADYRDARGTAAA